MGAWPDYPLDGVSRRRHSPKALHHSHHKIRRVVYYRGERN